MGDLREDGLDDNGLCVSPTRPWSAQKHRLISNYARILATGMKKKWDCRVYVDLFAGAGIARVKDTGELVRGSPILALEMPDKFDRYVFCEAEEEYLLALKKRVVAGHPDANVAYVHGDSNENVDRVLAAIPEGNPRHKVLTLCGADPYSTKDLAFATIRRLSTRRMDFLVLIASFMDANRNEEIYAREGDKRIERFLGNPSWRDEWREAMQRPDAKFGTFIVSQFTKEMKKLGYLAGTPVPVRLAEKNVRLYHLAFYSRHQLGITFWDAARKSSDDQKTLFDV